MSRRRRGQRPRAPSGSRAQPRQQRPPKQAVDPVALYREAAGYGRVLRSALAIALSLLATSLAIRAAGGQPPPEIGAGGALIMLGYLSAGVVKHYRGLYRVRREGAWQPSARFTAAMLATPFGIGDPRSRRYDRVLLGLTVALAVAAVALLITATALRR